MRYLRVAHEQRMHVSHYMHTCSLAFCASPPLNPAHANKQSISIQTVQIMQHTYL